MQAGGSWYEPDVKPAAEVDKMALRFTVDSTANLATINNATFTNADGSHTFMLVQGDATVYKPDDQLAGNGRVIYAVDEHGEKFRVTGDAFGHLGSVPIANVTQAAVDSTQINGTLEAPGGSLFATAKTGDTAQDQAITSANAILGGAPPVVSTGPGTATITHADTPPIPVAAPPAPDAPSIIPATTPASAVLTSGPFAGYTQAQADAFIAGVNGTAVTATAPAAPATAPAQPPAPTDEALTVSNSGKSTGQFQIIKGDATDYKPDDQLVGNGRAIYVVNAAGQKFHVTGDLMNAMIADGTWHDPDIKSQAEVDAKPNGSSVSLTTIDQLRSINIGAGSEYKLVKDADNDSVYAITSTGGRYHVSQHLAGEMGASFSNIDTLNPGESSKFGAVKGELNNFADLNKVTKDQSAAAGGFDGDTSGLPGGIPPVQGYSNPH